MAKQKDHLPHPVKVFIVQKLACFHTPSEVVDLVKEEFAADGTPLAEGAEPLVITRQRVETYNPTRAAGVALGEEMTAVFNKARETYLRETNDVPIAHMAYRLNELQRLYSRVKKNSPANVHAQREVLEHAAKEIGGAFTNTRKLTGPNGGPIQTQEQPPDLSNFTEKELEALAVVAAAAERNREGAGPPKSG